MSAFDEPEVCRGILESLPIGLCVVDLQKRIVLWSDGAERITGRTRHEVIGHSCVPEPLLHCDQPGCEFCAEDCPLAAAIRTAHGVRTTGFVHHKSGHEIPVRARAVAVHNQHGSIIGAVETFEILQPAAGPDRCEFNRQLPECVDTITGLATRSMMQSHLRQALASLAELQVGFGVLLFRLEALPRFRASLGTEAASSLLRVVARTIESTIGVADFVGRWSDDQFLVILTGCREEALRSVRERVRRTLAGEGIEWWGERRTLPVSIGEAFAQRDDSIEALIERAQKSLDAAAAWRGGTNAAGGANSSTGS